MGHGDGSDYPSNYLSHAQKKSLSSIFQRAATTERTANETILSLLAEHAVPNIPLASFEYPTGNETVRDVLPAMLDRAVPKALPFQQAMVLGILALSAIVCTALVAGSCLLAKGKFGIFGSVQQWSSNQFQQLHKSIRIELDRMMYRPVAQATTEPTTEP